MTQAHRLPFMPSHGIDADVVARAEAALKSLSAQFSRWLQDEIDKMDAARAAVGLEGLSSPAGEALYTRAHDLKGLGGTYEFPIVTRAAGSLCRVVDNEKVRAASSLSISSCSQRENWADRDFSAASARATTSASMP